MNKKSSFAYTLKNRLSLPAELAKIIMQQIRDGVYSPGDVLPSEQSLAEYFSVSRTVVREALARLKYEGMILSKRGSGPIVCETAAQNSFTIDIEQLSPEEFAQFMEFRLMMECSSTELAAVRRTDEHLAALEDCLEKMRQAKDEHKSGTDPDFMFHRLIAEASGNMYLKEFAAFLGAKLWLGVNRARFLSNQDSVRSALVWEEHRAILDGIREQNPERAKEACRTHLLNSAKRQNWGFGSEA